MIDIRENTYIDFLPVFSPSPLRFRSESVVRYNPHPVIIRSALNLTKKYDKSIIRSDLIRLHLYSQSTEITS